MSEHDTDGSNEQNEEHETAAREVSPALNSGGYERAGADFESDVSLDDTQVPDFPVVVRVPGYGKCSARLVTNQRFNELLDKSEGDDAEGLESQFEAELLKEHYVSPDFSGLTGEKIDNAKMGAFENFLRAIAPDYDALIRQQEES